MVGFCGSTNNHKCITNYKPVVGVGDLGYNKMVDSFKLDKVGGFARVIVVNPLHEKTTSFSLGCQLYLWLF